MFEIYSVKGRLLARHSAAQSCTEVRASRPRFTTSTLIGKSEGDSVLVKAPGGDVEYEILAVRYE